MTNILLFIILFLVFATAIAMMWFLYKHSKKCPRCGKLMNVATVRLICNKCGYTE